MKSGRPEFLFLTSLLIVGSIGASGLRAEEVVENAADKCAAATPVMNPWSKRLPSGWWEKRHDEILSAPGRKEAQIVFIGDSITDGWDSDDGGLRVWEKEYVPMKALNLGINCDSTQHVLWRLDHGEIDGLPSLKVAVVMIGVNNKGITRDKPEDIAVGIEAICERLKEKAPQAKVLLLGLFPRFFGQDNNDDVNGLISELDDGKQVFYLNINQQLLATEGAIRDRVGHLTAKGYGVWSDAIRPTLKKLMQEEKADATLEDELPRKSGGSIYEEARAASVEVLADGHLTGSGWLAHPSGLVVTAAHVVHGHTDERLAVRSAGLGRLDASLIATDRGHDIALLRLPRRGQPYPHLRVAKDMPPPGATVYLFGSALFRHDVMVRGSVARAEPTYEYVSDQAVYLRCYHISAPSPPGMSGGCWLDERGRVVGSQSAFLSRDNVGLGIAMVAPSDAIDQLVRTRRSAVTPTLGTAIEELCERPPAFIKRFPDGADGLLPVRPAEGGAAQKAGLVGEWLITHADDTRITVRDSLLRHVRSKAPGANVTLRALPPDGGPPREFTITLERIGEDR